MTAEHRSIDEGSPPRRRIGMGVVDPAPLLDALAALRRHIYRHICMEMAFLFQPVLETGPSDANPGDAPRTRCPRASGGRF